MLRRWMPLVLTLAGCGRIHQHSERYVVVDAADARDPLASIGLEPTRTESDEGFDREIREGAPYTVYLRSRVEQRVDAPLRLHELRLHIGTRHVDIHDASKPALEAPLAPSGEPNHWDALIRVPLGDQLAFVEGDVVSLELELTVPGEERPRTLTRAYRGEIEDASGAKIDAIVGQ